MFIVLLIIIDIILLALNYTPGTFLMGWDNVMPELNIGLNFKRAIFGVWQEYRGLGLIDGLSHTANLMHTVYIFLLDLILPQSFVRYFFITLTHLAGGIGMYLLLNKQLEHKKSAFLGALFYMFNIGILQMYFAPLEVFAVHFAALPLLAYQTLQTFQHPSRKNYLCLFLAMLLTTPQSFVPTIFITFSIFYGLLLLTQTIFHHKFKTAFFIGIVFICVNAFWMLPYVYSASQTTKVIPHTRINQFSSEEIFYRNKSFGNLADVLTFKGFMMDTVEYNTEKHFNDYFLLAWRKHFDFLPVQILAFLMTVIAFWGIISLVKDRKKDLYPYLGTAAVALFFLANNSPLFEQANTFIRNVFPVVGEIFRFPFTKFITVFAFSLSVLFAYGVKQILDQFVLYRKHVFGLVVAVIFILALPAFQGNFYSPLLRVKLPEDYKQLFSYMNTVDENKRVALLPMHTFWNWEYRTWGQRGSGFLWYGLPQPILKRPFDPWSFQNEQFYNEASHAINSENVDLFNSVLEKYDISYLLVDQYFINNLSTKPINYARLERFLTLANKLIEKEKEYGKLVLYKVRSEKSPLYTLDSSVVRATDDSLFTRKDATYQTQGNYITAPDATTAHPFQTLYTEKLQEDFSDYTIERGKETVKVTRKTPITLASNNTRLEIASMFQVEHLIPVRTEVKNSMLILHILTPRVIVNNKRIEIKEDPLEIPITINSPTKITFVDSQHAIAPGEKTYLKNNFINAIKVSNGKQEEIVTIDTKQLNPSSIQIPVGEKTLTVALEFDTIVSPYSNPAVITGKSYEVFTPAQEIIQMNQKHSAVEINREKEVVFDIIGNSADLAAWVPTLPHQTSYIIFIDTNHDSGLPLTFYIDNPFEKRADLETRLSKTKSENVVILPKTQEYYEGYGFHVINKSLGKERARNVVEELSFYPIPLEMVKTMHFTSTTSVLPVPKKPIDFTKKNFAMYSPDTSHLSPNTYLVLSQSYNKDWKAYQDGKELTDHVVVNGWANGWKIDPRSQMLDARNKDNAKIEDPGTRSRILIIFWPQYLTFIGYGFLVLALIAIAVKTRNHLTKE